MVRWSYGGGSVGIVLFCHFFSFSERFGKGRHFLGKQQIKNQNRARVCQIGLGSSGKSSNFAAKDRIMQIKTFYFNPFRVCTYVVSDEQGNAVIIDAGCQSEHEKERLAEYVRRQDLHVRAHLLTHGHLDHLMGARFVYETYGVLPHLSPADEFYFARQAQQATAFGCPLEDEQLDEYQPLEDNQTLQFGDLLFQVISTPGHTQGCVCFLLESGIKSHESGLNTAPLLFSGDTLFCGGIGRTDLPGGDYATLIRSIQKRILPLPDETQIYPGHGYETTLRMEKESNPYL